LGSAPKGNRRGHPCGRERRLDRGHREPVPHDGDLSRRAPHRARRRQPDPLLAGFRPENGPAQWAAAAGLLTLLAFALTWPPVALGMVADSPETASNLPLPLMFLPFPGSGFVPTTSMPAGRLTYTYIGI
jgi:hypothetical protein